MVSAGPLGYLSRRPCHASRLLMSRRTAEQWLGNDRRAPWSGKKGMLPSSVPDIGGSVNGSQGRVNRAERLA